MVLRPCLEKNPSQERAGQVAQVVERLPSKHGLFFFVDKKTRQNKKAGFRNSR
jgi:hypothetical protein